MVKWPRKHKRPKISGMRPHLIILDDLIETHEYSNLDRMDGLKESQQRHPTVWEKKTDDQQG